MRVEDERNEVMEMCKHAKDAALTTRRGAVRCQYFEGGDDGLDACQYAIDVAMPEYRCQVRCQYAKQYTEIATTDRSSLDKIGLARSI